MNTITLQNFTNNTLYIYISLKQREFKYLSSFTTNGPPLTTRFKLKFWY